jgi:hypothetical protein
MLCPNNFVIIGVGENILGLTDEISKLTGLKAQEVALASTKIIVATKEECMLKKTTISYYFMVLFSAKIYL